ncbi:MAG: polysaccharide biosynthesis C-terminal domain-containing protein [Clostridia bacterium]|nr:polysaccharide biosynthesis C-terminal domain-containing protein [Clostridia bacterium]
MKIVKKIQSLLNQDYFFSVFSKLIGVGLAVIYSAFYNRYLGTVLKGEAAIISNYISIISSFAAMGMYQAYPFYKKKDKDVFYPFVNNMTSLYFLMMVACLILTFTLPISFNLKIAISIVPIQSYIRQINYVVMVEAPKRRNISSIVISVTDLIVVLAFFLLSEASYVFLICILLVQQLINLVISYGNLRVDIKKLRFDLGEIPKYFKFGIIPMFTLLLMTLNYRIDILMLDDVFSVSTSEIGVYSVGVALAEKIWLIPDATKDILMSRLSNGADGEEVAKVTRTSLAVSVLMLALMILLGKPVILILYGSEFVKAYEILVIMLIGVIGMVFYKMIYAYNVANGKRVINLLFLSFAAIANIIGNYLLIPVGGIVAAAWSSVISYVICGMAFLIYFCHIEKIRIKDIVFVKKSDIKSMFDLIKK